MVFLANDWFFRFWVLFYVMVLTSLSPQLALGLIFIPHVMASPQSGPFPSVAFKDFSDFTVSNKTVRVLVTFTKIVLLC